MAAPLVTPNRNKLIAKIKIGQANLKLDDDTYRDFLELHGGKRSCADLAEAALTKVASAMEAQGAFKTKKTGRVYRQGGAGPGRPTAPQIRKLAALARDRGWDGLEDPCLIAFITRTAGVDDPRFLTRAAMTDVITGLEKWRAGE